MLRKLFGFTSRPAKSTTHVAAAPPATRIYAIGDIHGRLDLVRELHRLIKADACGYDGMRVVIHIGDYIDRGPDSRQVLDYLLDSPMSAFESIYLLGNHERTMLEFLDDITVGPGWLRYGGIETLHSYGITPDPDVRDPPEQFRQVQAALRRELPGSHRRFLEGLRLTHVEGDYLFVHAGVRPGVPIERQCADDLLWIRDEFLLSVADHGKVVVHGHSINRVPERYANRIGIDTGAYATGRLTSVRLEGSACSFIQTGG